MKSSFVGLLLVLIFLSSCKPSYSPNLLLNTSNLSSHFIEIKSGGRYHLKAPKGGRFVIQENSFDVPKGTVVKVEVKEAYSMADILLAGLETKSGNRQLSSGGMIYFDATAAGKKVKIKEPIVATIPSPLYNEDMQLFKGEVDDNGKIDWVKPQALDTAPAAKQVIFGEQMFKANCGNCHKLFDEYTGPGIAGVTTRIPNRQWHYDFIRNPARMIAIDAYSKKLFNVWKPTVMTGFTGLSNADIDAIYAYIENEEKKNPELTIKAIEKANKLLDKFGNDIDMKSPCGSDTFYIPPIDTNAIIEIVDSLDYDNLPENTIPVINPADYGPKNGYKYINPDPGMYTFKIDNTGWYNIDVYTDGQDGVTTVQLSAAVKGTDVDMHVMVCVPSMNILMEAPLHKDGRYVFKNEDGSFLLKKDAEAFIFAIGGSADDMYYGVTNFIVKDKQEVVVNVSKSSEAEIKKIINSNDIKGIKIDMFKQEKIIRDIPCDAFPQPNTVSADSLKKVK